MRTLPFLAPASQPKVTGSRPCWRLSLSFLRLSSGAAAVPSTRAVAIDIAGICMLRLPVTARWNIWAAFAVSRAEDAVDEPSACTKTNLPTQSFSLGSFPKHGHPGAHRRKPQPWSQPAEALYGSIQACHASGGLLTKVSTQLCFAGCGCLARSTGEISTICGPVGRRCPAVPRVEVDR